MKKLRAICSSQSRLLGSTGGPLAAVLLTTLAGCAASQFDDSILRQNLAERMPGIPQIDEIRETSMSGIYELRVGQQVLYSDGTGNHLIQGAIYDTKAKVDLTKARIDKLTAIDFNTLPIQDALVTRHGDGSRRLAVFADPNCGYCKHLEQELADVKDVTIYVFPLPVLGEASHAKARDIWCSADAASGWHGWMLRGIAPAPSSASCDASALERNMTFAKSHLVQGTPALVFEDGSRNAGTLAADAIDARLKAAGGKS